jgi:hypothetical protein
MQGSCNSFLRRIGSEDETMGELICYCFDYTDMDIELDLLRNGKSTIMEKILAEKRMGSCQCGIKNPKGR